MVTVLQLNRLEPARDASPGGSPRTLSSKKAGDAGEELSPEEVQQLLEAERVSDPADSRSSRPPDGDGYVATGPPEGDSEAPEPAASAAESRRPACWPSRLKAPKRRNRRAQAATDPFEEIDFGSFFDDYLDRATAAPPPSRSTSRPSRPSCPRPSRWATTCAPS